MEAPLPFLAPSYPFLPQRKLTCTSISSLITRPETKILRTIRGGLSFPKLPAVPSSPDPPLSGDFVSFGAT